MRIHVVTGYLPWQQEINNRKYVKIVIQLFFVVVIICLVFMNLKVSSSSSTTRPLSFKLSFDYVGAPCVTECIVKEKNTHGIAL